RHTQPSDRQRNRKAPCQRKRTRHRHFFFQAEDGIRGKLVTGVQTCALPILDAQRPRQSSSPPRRGRCASSNSRNRPTWCCCQAKIGRASCRERVEISGGGGPLTTKTENDGGRRAYGERSKRSPTEQGSMHHV